VFSNAPEDDAESKRSLHLRRMNSCEKSRECGEHALVPFTQECGQNVFADALTPEMVAAVAARVSGGVEVHPVILGSARDAIAAGADALTAEPEAPLQTVEVDATCGVEVDLHFFCHVLLPIRGYDSSP
jgi:hypothetical protein